MSGVLWSVVFDQLRKIIRCAIGRGVRVAKDGELGFARLPGACRSTRAGGVIRDADLIRPVGCADW